MIKFYLTYSYDDGPLWIHNTKESADRGKEEYASYSVETDHPNYEGILEELRVYEVELYKHD